MTRSDLLGEIRKYNIVGVTQVRGVGSLHAKHPNRCLWEICGKPSIQWVLEAGKGSKYIGKLVVGTESKEIQKVVEGLGVTVVLRPYFQSLDRPRDYNQGPFVRAKPRSVLSVASPIYLNQWVYISWYLEKTEGYKADIIVVLPANGPMITTEIIDRMIELFFEDEEVSIVNNYYPILPYVYTVNSVTGRIFPVFVHSGLDRQIYPPFYRQGMGSVSGLPSKVTTGGVIEGHLIIKPEEGLDMHNEEDLFLARCYMKRRLESKREGNDNQGST